MAAVACGMLNVSHAAAPHLSCPFQVLWQLLGPWLVIYDPGQVEDQEAAFW